MIIIIVRNELDRFMNKCLKYNIDLYNIERTKEYLQVRVNEDDLEKIIKMNYYSDIEVVKYLGIKGILINLKKYSYDFIMLLVFLISLYFISNVILSVEIKHENKNLIKKINEILLKKNIKKFTINKTLGELNEISDEILFENRDFLDWISINKTGMKYIVSFEERILTQKEEKQPYCHVVASKDGVITSIIAKSGVNMVENAQYVKKGDILITGEIILNEEVKDNICAEGIVMAETWYKINISIPLNYEEKEYTHKKRYNLLFNGNPLRKDKYSKCDRDNILKIGPLKLVKEKEYTIITQNYSHEEAVKMGLDLASKRLLEKIGKNNTIIEQKVLKEETNNSKIVLEVFISVNEAIGKTEYFKVGDKVDPE